MSLFVHYDNQTILWETIQQHPYVTMIPPAQRASWFKHHIQTIYENAPASWFAPPMTTEKLNHANQQTMQYMVNDLKMMAGSSSSSSPPLQQRPNNLASNAGVQQRSDQIQTFDMHLGEGPYSFDKSPEYDNKAPPPYLSSRPMNDRQQGGGGEEFKDKSLYDQFLQKQQDIESMLQNKQVNPIDFKISEIDAPITNIDELIQRQLRDRELDVMTPPIHQYSPSGTNEPVATVPPPPSPSPNVSNIPKPLKIDSNELGGILELNIQEIKQVEFEIPMESLEKRLNRMEETMKQQFEHLKQMNERIHVLEQIQNSYLFQNPPSSEDLVVEGILPSDQENDQEEEEEEIRSIEESEP